MILKICSYLLINAAISIFPFFTIEILSHLKLCKKINMSLCTEVVTNKIAHQNISESEVSAVTVLSQTNIVSYMFFLFVYTCQAGVSEKCFLCIFKKLLLLKFKEYLHWNCNELCIYDHFDITDTVLILIFVEINLNNNKRIGHFSTFDLPLSAIFFANISFLAVHIEHWLNFCLGFHLLHPSAPVL